VEIAKPRPPRITSLLMLPGMNNSFYQPRWIKREGGSEQGEEKTTSRRTTTKYKCGVAGGRSHRRKPDAVRLVGPKGTGNQKRSTGEGGRAITSLRSLAGTPMPLSMIREAKAPHKGERDWEKGPKKKEKGKRPGWGHLLSLFTKTVPVSRDQRSKGPSSKLERGGDLAENREEKHAAVHEHSSRVSKQEVQTPASRDRQQNFLWRDEKRINNRHAPGLNSFRRPLLRAPILLLLKAHID